MAIGGNCELTRPGETYVYDKRVTIVGATDLTSRMSWQSSSMFVENMASLLSLLCKDHKFAIDMEDPVIRGMTCVYNGKITWPPPASAPAVVPESAIGKTRGRGRKAPATPCSQANGSGP